MADVGDELKVSSYFSEIQNYIGFEDWGQYKRRRFVNTLTNPLRGGS